jgi:hypothetical protein
MTAPNFPAIAASAKVAPVVIGGVLNTLLVPTSINGGAQPAGQAIVGILDLETLNKVFNPVAEGNNVQSGQAYTMWLPTITNIFAATITDNYWEPTFAGFSPAGDYTAPVSTGMVTIQMTPAAANVVEAPSVMTYKVSPNALVLYVDGVTSTPNF